LLPTISNGLHGNSLPASSKRATGASF
jgi:hypothetical protein